MMLDSSVRLQAQGPTRQAAIALYDKMVENAAKNYDANDFLYWLESSWDYDPQPDLGKIKAALVTVSFADDAVNPFNLDVVEKFVKTIPTARFVLVPESGWTSGHLMLSLAAIWKPYLEELLRVSSQASVVRDCGLLNVCFQKGATGRCGPAFARRRDGRKPAKTYH